MKARTLIPLFLASVTIVPIANCLKVTITNGDVTQIGAQEVRTSFGMVVGAVNFKLGSYKWPAKEIWLVPEGSSPEDFKAIGTYLEIPENLTFSTCKTSVYYNESLGYAFKILPSQIMRNGSFCGLAYEGSYDVIAAF